MNWLDALGAFVGGGGLAGAVTGVTATVAKLHEKRLDYAHALALLPHEQDRWRYETTIQRQHAEHEQRLADQDLLIESERGAWDSQEAAIEADSRDTVAALAMSGQRWWVGAIRTLIRPIMTAALWLLVAVVWYAETDPGTNQLVVAAILNAAMGTAGFWFGGRVIGSSTSR